MKNANQNNYDYVRHVFLFCMFWNLTFLFQLNAQNNINQVPMSDTIDHKVCGSTPEFMKYMNDLYANNGNLSSHVDSVFQVNWISQSTFNQSYPSAIDQTCTQYFRIYYEDVALNTNLGFDHPTLGADRRATLCKVLNDIEDIIDFSALGTQRVDLLVSASYDLYGTNINLPPFFNNTTNGFSNIFDIVSFSSPFFAQANASGFFGGNMRDHIILGIDPDAANYDGSLLMNFFGQYNGGQEQFWNNHNNTPADCSFDLYSILLHEITHIMGWYSNINQGFTLSPMSFFFQNGYGQNTHFFSLLDQHLGFHSTTTPNFLPTTTPNFTPTNQSLIPLVTYNQSQPIINNTINTNPIVTAINNSTGGIITAIGGNRIWLGLNGAPNSHPVLSESFIDGIPIQFLSSINHTDLSHMDYTLNSFYSRTQFSPGFQEPYVMSKTFSPNEQRRKWTHFELRTLNTLLGYQFTTIFLGNSNTYYDKYPYTTITQTANNNSIINNSPPYRILNNVPNLPLISYPYRDYYNNNQFQPDMLALTNHYLDGFYPIDFTINNNNSNFNPTQTQQVVSLPDMQNVAPPTIKDDDGDAISIMPNSLFGIRGVSKGGNNHDALTISPDWKTVTYTPNPGFTGIAQFGFHLWDGKERGAFKVVTIQVNPSNMGVNPLPPNGEMVLNGDFEEGTEVKQVLDINHQYSMLYDGLHFVENILPFHFSDGHPYNDLFWTNAFQYNSINVWSNYNTILQGVIIEDANHFCADNNPSNNYTFMGSGFFQTNYNNFSGTQANCFMKPSNNTPIPNHRYGWMQWDNGIYMRSSTISTLRKSVEPCHSYKLSFDIGFYNSLSLVNINEIVPINIQFTDDPSGVYPNQTVNFTLPIHNAVVSLGNFNQNCYDNHWERIEIPFTYCGTLPSNFLQIGGTNGAQYGIDNISLIETNNTSLNLSITATNPSNSCGLVLMAQATGSLCQNVPITYSWSTGQTTSSINVSTNGTYTCTISICGTTISETYTVTTVPNNGVDAGNDIEAYANCPTALQAVINGNPNGATFTWSPSTGLSNPNILNPTVNLPAGTNITYTLTVVFANGCTASDQVNVSILETPPNCLSIQKTIADENTYGNSFADGEKVLFKIQVTNTCNQTLQNVVIEDILPAGLNFLPAGMQNSPSSAGWALNANTLSLTIQSLAPNQTVIYQVYCSVNLSGFPSFQCLEQVTNCATAFEPATCQSSQGCIDFYYTPENVDYSWHALSTWQLENNPNLPQYIGTNTVIGKKIVLDEVLWVNSDFTFEDCEIILSPGTNIQVGFINNAQLATNNPTLTFKNCTIHGCEKMWQSIHVAPIARLIVDNTRIEDGFEAIVPHAAFTQGVTYGSYVWLNNVTFLNNHTGVYIPDENKAKPTVVFKGDIIFDSDAGLLPDYHLVNPITMGARAFAGIRAHGFPLYIAPSGSCTFNNLNYGIITYSSDVYLRRCIFQNIQPDNSYTLPIIGNNNFNGTGLWMMGDAFQPNVVNQSGWLSNGGNAFDNCKTGIVDLGMWKAEIGDNQMNNMRNGIVVMGVGAGKRAHIFSNQITAHGMGIGTLWNAASDGILIEENTLDIQPSVSATVGQAVGIYVGGWLNSENIVIRNNTEINLNTGGIGIQINTSKDNVASNNRVNLNAGLQLPNGTAIANQIAGIQINAADKNTLTCNSVLADPNANQLTPPALPTALFNSDYMGLRVNFSQNNLYECNATQGTKYGFFFEGNCYSPNNIKGNQWGDHRIGIFVDASSFVGLQEATVASPQYGGNTFVGTAAGPGILDAFCAGFAPASQFKVNQVANPDCAPAIQLPIGFFQPFTDFPNFECENSMFCGGVSSLRSADSLITEIDFDIVRDSLLTFDYDTEAHEVGAIALYERLSKYPALRTHPEMQTFFQMANTGNIGTQYALRSLLKSWAQTDTLIKNFHHSVSQSLDLLNNQRVYNDSLLQLYSDSTALIIANQALRLQLDSLMADWEALLSIEAGQDSLLRNEITAENEAWQPSSLQTENEQAITEIYLGTIARGNFNFTTSQQADIYAIAAQCPLTGGAGVYLARTLFKWINDSIGFDDKYSCHQHNISFRQSNITQDIQSSATVYPNPADDLLHVTLSNRQIEAIFVLYNTLGQCVVKQKMEDALQISTTNLSNGIYYWEIQTEGQHKHAGKVIIQH